MNGPEPTTLHTPGSTPAAPDIFRTKTLSSTAFAVGVLLFLLPFAEVKCNGNPLANNTGLGIAIGREWKASAKGMFGNDFMNGANPSKISNQKQDPNIYAILALALGITGFALSLTAVRASIGSALVSGILSAGALTGLMIDLKKEVRTPLPDEKNTFSDNIGDNMKITVDFTPWLYIALIAFLVATFFCYKRLQSLKGT